MKSLAFVLANTVLVKTNGVNVPVCGIASSHFHVCSWNICFGDSS